MIFHKKPPRELPQNLRIEGGEVQYETQVKYLGVILDQKLNSKKHIADKTAKARRAIHSARNKIRGTIGPPSEKHKMDLRVRGAPHFDICMSHLEA